MAFAPDHMCGGHTPGFSASEPRAAASSADPVPKFEFVQQIVRETIVDYTRWSESPTADLQRAEIRRSLKGLTDFYSRRAFAEAYERFVTSDPLLGWIGSVFLSFRDRSAMVDYIRFQECAHVQSDGSDPLAYLADGIRENLGRLGRRPHPVIKVRVQFNSLHSLQFHLCLDPFSNYRSIYTRALRSARANHTPSWVDLFANAADRLAARAKVKAMKLGAHVVARGWAKFAEPAGLRDSLIDMFPAASSLTEADVDDILSSLFAYFSERADSLIECFPQAVIDNGGVAKLLKLAIGTLIGRANAGHSADAIVPYITDSIKIAYCWAITYPLVDDVLDASTTDATRRLQLRDLFQALVAGGQTHLLHGDKSYRELRDRMEELLLLIGPGQRDRATGAIWNVFEAHFADSRSKLGDHGVDGNDALETAMLKSLLVRIATIEICGIPAATGDYRTMAAVALFNQLGDDIWDADEDLAERRVTPVTLYLTGSGPDVYEMYLNLAAFLVSRSPIGTARAAGLAICHTFKLANDVGTPLTRAQLRRSLAAFAPTADTKTILTCTPHVDPDSMLFDVERALRPFALSMCRYITR